MLKDIAESGYNIGYAAKKHLTTYDIVEKAPGWISILSFVPLSATQTGGALIVAVVLGLLYCFLRGLPVNDVSLFSQFRRNLSASNTDEISTKFANITTRLNLDFWEIESDTR